MPLGRSSLYLQTVSIKSRSETIPDSLKFYSFSDYNRRECLTSLATSDNYHMNGRNGNAY